MDRFEKLSGEFRVPWPAGVPFPSREDRIPIGAHHFAVVSGTIERRENGGRLLERAVVLEAVPLVLLENGERRVVGKVDGLEVLGCPCGSSDLPETWAELLRIDVRAKCGKCDRATSYFAHKRQALQAWNAGNFEPVQN